jgi:hypothetical protein
MALRSLRAVRRRSAFDEAARGAFREGGIETRTMTQPALVRATAS